MVQNEIFGVLLSNTVSQKGKVGLLVMTRNGSNACARYSCSKTEFIEVTSVFKLFNKLIVLVS
jgi:hypothetical protein